MRPPHRTWLVLSLSFVSTCYASYKNVTIDDTNGGTLPLAKASSVASHISPVYVPSNNWRDTPCDNSCPLKVDPSQAFQETWREVTYKPGKDGDEVSTALDFEGTGVHVYFILANSQREDMTTETLCNFTLDGNPDGYFHWQPPAVSPRSDSEQNKDGFSDLSYNQLVYSRTGLSQNFSHSLVISTGNQSREYWLALDYVTITYDDTEPPYVAESKNLSSSDDHPRPPKNIGTIIGATLGSALVICIAILIYVLCRRRRRPAKSSQYAGDAEEKAQITRKNTLSDSSRSTTSSDDASTIYPSVINVPAAGSQYPRTMSMARSSTASESPFDAESTYYMDTESQLASSSSGYMPSLSRRRSLAPSTNSTSDMTYVSTYHLTQTTLLDARQRDLQSRLEALAGSQAAKEAEAATAESDDPEKAYLRAQVLALQEKLQAMQQQAVPPPLPKLSTPPSENPLSPVPPSPTSPTADTHPAQQQ